MTPTAFNNVAITQTPLQVDVTTQAGCGWSAASNATWVTISSGTNGTGNGRVELTAAENTGAARSGTLVIAGQTVTINQQAFTPTPVPCTFQVAPTTFNTVSSTQSPLQVDVTTQAGCAWTAASNATWVTISSGANGTGNGRVELTAAENTGAARSGTLVIAGETVTVNQQAFIPTPVPCTFQVAPAAFNNVASAQTPLQVDVTTQAGCAWTAASNATWVTISSGANGTGNGRVELTAAENTGAARSGTLVIAGQTVSVSQQAPPPCAYTISPTSYSPSSAAGSISVTVTTTSTCAWVVAGNPAWVSATPSSGTGAGTTVIAVQSNTGAARSATLKIADNDFVVQQGSAPCTYAAGPTTRTVPQARSTRTITVYTESHCPVSATENASWIEILTAPAFGTVDVTFRVQENRDDDPRSAPITITGENFVHTVTVIQEGNK